MKPNLVNKDNIPLSLEMMYSIMEYNLLSDIQKLMFFEDVGIYKSELAEILRTRELKNFNINILSTPQYFEFLYGTRDQFSSTAEALAMIYKWKFSVLMGHSPETDPSLKKELGYLSADVFYDDKAELYWNPEYIKEVPFDIVKGHIGEHIKYCQLKKEDNNKLKELILLAKYVKAIKLDKDIFYDTYYDDHLPFMKTYLRSEYFGFTENIAFYCYMGSLDQWNENI